MNKKFYISPSTALKIFAVFSLLIAPTSHADIVTPTGPTDPNWTMSLYQTPIISTPTVHGEEWFAIQRDASNSGSAQAMYTGAGNQLGDISGSLILATENPSNSYGSGLILRSASTDFSETNAYYLALIPADGNASGHSTLGLYWGIGTSWTKDVAPLTIQDLGDGTIKKLSTSADNQYYLEFSFIGSEFTANLYAWNSTTETLGSLLANLTYTETYTGVTANALSEGYLGLRGGRYGGNVTSYFRDLEVQAIPEPTSAAAVALLTLMGGAAPFLRRRRMSK